MCIASAVASVAVSVSSHLDFASINDETVFVSSCLSSSSCNLKVVGMISPSTCSVTAQKNFSSSSEPFLKKIFLFSVG